MPKTTYNGMTFTRSAAVQRIDRMLISCKNGRTGYELQVIFNIDRRTVGNYIRHLRTAGKVHVSGWTRENIGGRFYPVPIFKTGAGTDAPKPPPLPKPEVRARAWAKLKSDTKKYAEYRLTKRKTPPPKPTPAVFDWRGKPSIFNKEKAA
jgi:hypothetical protein